VGVFMDVGGPHVKIVSVVETGPNPIVFIALALKAILLFAGKMPPVTTV